MTRFVFGHGMVQIGRGFNLESANVYVTLLMTNTTCDTELDKVIIGPGAGGFTTVDEFDGVISGGEPSAGTPFPTGGELLVTAGWDYTTVPARRVRYTPGGGSHTFSNGENYDTGTRQIQAYLIWLDVAGAGVFADGTPLIYDDGPILFPFDPAGDFIKITPSAGAYFFAQSDPLV